jgi:hypothetical protein
MSKANEPPKKPICINGISSNLCSSIRGKECPCAEYERKLKEYNTHIAELEKTEK